MAAWDRIAVVNADRLDLEAIEPGHGALARVALCEDALGDPIRVPVMVIRGRSPGPVVGLTAAVHGNELNGVRVIHKVMAQALGRVDAGWVVGVPIVNVPGFVRHRRELNDGGDLNLAMPGRRGGRGVDVYAHELLDRIVGRFNYLIDLHTASFGRINSVYVRADLRRSETAWMARAQHPHLIVHHTGADGTLRSAAMARGIHAITVELGDPQVLQKDAISRGAVGVRNVLARLGVVDLAEVHPPQEPVVCSRSYWLYAEGGGLLEVYPALTAPVHRGEVIARLTDLFGRVTAEYTAPEDGIVVGRSTNPVAQTGARILHLGVVGDPDAGTPRGDIE